MKINNEVYDIICFLTFLFYYKSYINLTLKKIYSGTGASTYSLSVSVFE